VHTRPWADTDPYFGHFVSNVLARIAVPLFFMFAGYFLFRHLRREDRPPAYFRAYAFHLARIYLVWSLIYLPYDLHKLLAAGDSFAAAGEEYLCDFFLRGGHFYLWFFPALIYAVAILSFFFTEKRMGWLRVLVIALYIAGLLGEPYQTLVAGAPGAGGFLNLIYHTGSSRSALFFALPFLVWGFSDQERLERMGLRRLGAGFLLGLGLLALESFFLEGRGHAGGYDLYAFLPLAAYFAFGLLLRNPRRLSALGSKTLRDMSLLAYCSHGLFLIFVEEYLPSSLHNADRFVLCLSLTLVFSYLVLRSEKLRRILI
jgi:serine/alanine racemase